MSEEETKVPNFTPIEFVPVYGSGFDVSKLKGSTLVIPCLSAGMGASIGTELFVLNEGMTKAGYLKSEYISPAVSNDQFTVEGATPGQMTMPCEVYFSADGQYTFFILRSGIVHGRMWPFGFAFSAFVQQCGFRDVSILTGTISPVRRARESNREIPEIYAYVNNFLHKKTKNENGDKSFYETFGIKKLGHWLGKDKKRAH